MCSRRPSCVAVGEPARHQVEELPPITVRVTEHRCQRVRCPGCGERARPSCPARSPRSAFGPRFQAAVAALSVRNRVSRRDVVELVRRAVRRARSAPAASTRSSTAPATRWRDPYEELLERLRAQRGAEHGRDGLAHRRERRALWGMFTSATPSFSVAPDRHEDHAKSCSRITPGIVTSDRWWAYRTCRSQRRQLCWSHLQRDFQRTPKASPPRRSSASTASRSASASSGPGRSSRHTHDRRELKRTIRALQRELQADHPPATPPSGRATSAAAAWPATS